MATLLYHPEDKDGHLETPYGRVYDGHTERHTLDVIDGKPVIDGGAIAWSDVLDSCAYWDWVVDEDALANQFFHEFCFSQMAVLFSRQNLV